MYYRPTVSMYKTWILFWKVSAPWETKTSAWRGHVRKTLFSSLNYDRIQTINARESRLDAKTFHTLSLSLSFLFSLLSSLFSLLFSLSLSAFLPTRRIYTQPRSIPSTLSPSSIMGGKHIPPEKINLKLILVSGRTKEYLFSPNESAGDIAQFVFDHWPPDWQDESVSRPEILRLIYQGRFLHGNVTLGALQLPTGKTSVMHLVPRENLPEPNSQGLRKRDKIAGESRCCSILWEKKRALIIIKWRRRRRKNGTGSTRAPSAPLALCF